MLCHQVRSQGRQPVCCDRPALSDVDESPSHEPCIQTRAAIVPCLKQNSTLHAYDLFRTNTAIVAASPQNLAGMFIALSMLLTIPTMVWLRHSITPFCCGEYGTVRCRIVPRSAQNAANSFDVNSPPRSMRRVCSLWPDSISAAVGNRWRDSAALSFIVSCTTHMNML
jgi:hypothetical protein